jgi:hypothetical protein
MATIRSRQFAMNAVAAAGLTTLGTVPAGHRWLLKDWRILSVAAAPGALSIYTFDPATGSAAHLVYEPAAVSGRLYSGIGYHVLEAGQRIIALVSSVAGGGSYLAVSGIDFQL